MSSAKRPPEQRRGSRGTRRFRDLVVWFAFGLVIVIAAAIILLQPKQPLPSEVQAAQAYQLYQQGAQFLDVRTEAEYAQGHIARSLLIPLDKLQARLGELSPDKPIVVICRSGTRSREGAAILREAGFTRVTCLRGGLQAWVAAGYPLGE
jgi:rhodanese-related sulfurtransferase